jgi:hypothetical protein
MNCQVVVGFAEILRSESKKEVLQALCNVFSIVPNLPKIVVYDAGCLMVRFLRNNYDNRSKPNSIRVTPQSKILHDSVKWMIDRFHLNNHVQVNLTAGIDQNQPCSLLNVEVITVPLSQQTSVYLH